MRFAFILTSLPLRRHLEAGPIDAEWLLDLSADHEIELFVDQSTAGSELLRQAGLSITVSLKRPVEGSDGQKASADALQARALWRSHLESAHDALIYGSDRAVDLAVFEPGLRSIPRVVALGSGLPRDLAAVWQDRRTFSRLSRTLHAATGFLASADFLLSDLPPECFGLVAGEGLPPRLGTGRPLPTASPEAPERATSWVAVSATALGVDDAETLLPRLFDAIPPRNETTYLIAIRAPIPEAAPIEEAILRGCPRALRPQVVIVIASDDGVAHDFLQSADLVVTATAAELSLRAVADAALAKGLVALAPTSPSAETPPTFPTGLASFERPKTNGTGLRVLTWQEPRAELIEMLLRTAEDMRADSRMADDLLLLHAADRAGPSISLFGLDDLRGVDLVTWARPDGILGHPDPSHLYPWALAVRAAAVPGLARVAGRCASIWDLICFAVSDEWIDRLRWLVLPAPADVEHWQPLPIDQLEPLDPRAPIDTPWSTRSGILPAPRWLATTVPTSPPAPDPLPVYFPRRRFVAKARAVPRVRLESWARRARWSERVRLALPWRFGWLEKAMEGRW